MSRIGVFICHCGTNIAGTVDVEAVAEAAKHMPNVVLSETNKYTCSDPGQARIKEAIEEHNLDRIVIGSCSPRMHEETFRKMLRSTKINPYMLEVANLREQCSWVHNDKEKSTPKAIDLVRMAVAKVDKNFDLFSTQLPITKRLLVIGGGIAGVQTALDVADAGYPVTIVERKPSIGGKMVMLDKTFPTMDCSACICTPKMSEAGAHPNITLKTYSEVEEITGYIGNFKVKIREKAKYIDYSKCTGCGACETKCPKKVDNEFDQNMSKRKAIYKMFAQAVPSKPVIDKENCTMLKTGKCGICSKVCPLGCINYEDQDKIVEEEYGAILLATGYELIDWTKIYGEYGGGRYKDVVTGLHFERMVNASGPTEGHIYRPSDGKQPESIAIIKCVGSRDPHKGKSYCSRACCMYGAKHAHQYIDKTGGDCYVFYMDVRTPGKRYDEFYMDTMVNDGAKYIRGRVSKIYEEDGKLICLSEDTLSGKQVQVAVDMVVLETAMVPAEGARDVGMMVGVQSDLEGGWLTEAHPKLKPVETNTGGVYVAGTCQGPKDIPDTVAQAGAAAAKICGLFSKPYLESNPMISSVDESKCSGCAFCEGICPYKAITMKEIPDRDPATGKKITRLVSSVNGGLCQGCGACTVACRQGAIDLLGFTNAQILEEVDALCR